MKIIGITGAIGAGKSEILSYLKLRYECFVLEADKVAHQLMQPGEMVYQELIALLGADILLENHEIDRKKMAEKIFSNPDFLIKVNSLIHPAVKRRIKEEIVRESANGRTYFIIEAALLIEDHYDEIVDELWYIYATKEEREQRLIKARGYSKDKIISIEIQQRSEEEFRRACDFVIDNNGTLAETYAQIDKKMEELQ